MYLCMFTGNIPNRIVSFALCFARANDFCFGKKESKIELTVDRKFSK